MQVRAALIRNLRFLVLAVVAGGTTRQEAAAKAHDAAGKIRFDGLQRRHDIGIFNFD